MPLDLPPDTDAIADRECPRSLLSHRELFRSALLRVDGVVARPLSERPSDERELGDHGLVLPYRGLFATHAGRRPPTLASASHAVLLSARTPYRYSYPGAVGDHCLVLNWSDDSLDRVAPTALRRGRFDSAGPAVAPVLEPGAVLVRERLRRLLAEAGADPLAVEEGAVALLGSVLRTVQRASRDGRPRRGLAGARNLARVERTKALVASAPERRWTLDALARAVAVSPWHLAHLFKVQVGISLYEYVLRARLAAALERVLHSQADLTTIALDAGFSSHSHFTAQFRARFGATPLELRRSGRVN